MDIKVHTTSKSKLNPDAYAVWTDRDGKSWSIEFEWKFFKHSAQVSGISISAINHKAPITARLLREFPMGRIEEQVREFHGKRIHGDKKNVFRAADKHQPSVSVAEIQQIANFYFEAQKNGDSPHQKIISELNISYPTASRRIRLARDMGLIPNPS
jgi:hypothetical protein